MTTEKLRLRVRDVKPGDSIAFSRFSRNGQIIGGARRIVASFWNVTNDRRTLAFTDGSRVTWGARTTITVEREGH